MSSKSSSKPKASRKNLLHAVKFIRYKRDCAHFITDAVYIEDKTHPDGIAKFKLWAEQLRALMMMLTLQFLIILKARQLGLTWLTLAYALWRMLFNKGYTVLFISKRDIPDCKIVALRLKRILRKLPDWLIREKKKVGKTWSWESGDIKNIDNAWSGLAWEASTHEITIYRPDGEESMFIALAASPDTAHSFTANLIILDEWALHPFAEEIWTGAYPTINRAGFSGQVIGLSSGRRNTMFEEIWNAAVKGLNQFKTIFLNWKADPRRDIKWYERTKQNLPKTYRSQYPTNPEDAFTVGEGAFFEEWDESVHLKPYPDQDTLRKCAKFISYDPAYNQSCWKWYMVFPDGLMRCYREYYPARTVDVKQALEVVRLSVNDDGVPEEIDYIVADTDAWTKGRGDGKSTVERCIEVFRNEAGKYDHTPREYKFIQATKTLEGGWRRLHEWLEPIQDRDAETFTALLTFTKDCANTRRTYPSCECSKTNPNDIDKSSEHHPQDVDRYAVMSRPEPAAPEAPPGPPPGSEAYLEEAEAQRELERSRYAQMDDGEDELTWMIETTQQQQ